VHAQNPQFLLQAHAVVLAIDLFPLKSALLAILL
jgi:hypothetical protein